MRASKATIPPELRRKISPGFFMFIGGQGAFVRTAGFVGALMGLYGPVSPYHPGQHNGFLYLVGPWVFPSLIALLFTRFPATPSRGAFYSGDSRDIDRSDPVVMRLVELFKSSEARRAVWGSSLRLSVILFVILGAAAIHFRKSLEWNFPSPRNGFLWTGHWFWIGVVLCSIGCFAIVGADYFAWAVRTWAEREAAHHGGRK